jgi:hypothetical protein
MLLQEDLRILLVISKSRKNKSIFHSSGSRLARGSFPHSLRKDKRLWGLSPSRV